MKNKNDHHVIILTAFGAVFFSIASIFTTGKIIAEEDSSLRSGSGSTEAVVREKEADEKDRENADDEYRKKIEEQKKKLEEEANKAREAAKKEREKIAKEIAQKQEEAREKYEKMLEKELTPKVKVEVKKEETKSKIESVVKEAEKVEYHIVKKGSVEPKIYLGTGKKEDEKESGIIADKSSSVSPIENNNQNKQSWSLDYDFSNVPQGDYDLYAEVKNKYGTYSSEKTTIQVDANSAVEEVEIINASSPVSDPEKGGSKNLYLVTVNQEDQTDENRELQAIQGVEAEIMNDPSISEEEKKQRIEELSKEKDKLKKKFTFRSQLENAYEDGNKENASENQKRAVEEIKRVLQVDSDGDGLPDHEEERIGSDPFSADSDQDGYLDGDEVANGYNPLKASIEKGVDKIVFEEPKTSGKENSLYKVEKVEMRKEEKGDGEEKTEIVLEGKALPNSFITLYIYSDPIVVTVKTDEDGNWSYVLDKELEDGKHEVYSAVTDNTGKITSKSRAFSFVKTAQAVTAQDQIELANSFSPVEKGKGQLLVFVVMISIFSLISAVASMVLLMRNNKDRLGG